VAVSAWLVWSIWSVAGFVWGLIAPADSVHRVVLAEQEGGAEEVAWEKEP
jgi:hypothetical protein